MESHPIEARSPRRGSVGYYGYDDDYDGYYWPLYLYIIVAFIGLFCSLFFWSTVFYCVRERRRSRQGQPFRMGHVLWSAFKIASFLWIPIGIYHCCCASDRHKNKNNGAYAPIGQYQGANNNNGWYGAQAPAAASYGAGGTGYAPQGKFEPMGYTGASGATSIPMGPMSAPMPQQQPQQQPQQTQYQQPVTTGYSVPATPGPPPPYTGGQVPPTQTPTPTGGAAQGYLAGAHSSSAYTPSPTPPVQQQVSYAPAAAVPAPVTYPPAASYAPTTTYQQPYTGATYAPQQGSTPYYGQ